jgi:probable addiction module antidote protein
MFAYLEAALEEGDPSLIAAALGDIAKSKGIAQIARKTGLGRESLDKALSSEGNPKKTNQGWLLQAICYGPSWDRRVALGHS